MPKKAKIQSIQKVIVTYTTGDVYSYAMPPVEARKFFTDLVRLYLDYPSTGIYSIVIVDHRGVPYRSYVINYNKPSNPTKYERVF